MNWIKLYKLATRLTKKRNKLLGFANVVAICSVVVGCIALILSLSILNGFDEKLKETAIKFTANISVQTINRTEISDIKEYIKIIKNIAGVKEVIPVLQTEGLISNFNLTDGIVLQTIDIEQDIKDFKLNITSKLNDNIFSTNTANEIIISETLARKINAKIEDKILIYALKNENISINSATYKPFKIVALYNTGMQQYDNYVVFTQYGTMTKFLDKEKDVATYFEVFVNDIDDVSNVAKNIDAELGFPFYSPTFYDINRSIFAWIELQKEPIPIVLAIISIVATFNIITMLIITVVEKYHSIGILRTLGMTSQNIIKIFIILALKTATIGTIIGIAISLLFIYIQKKFNIIELDSKIYYVNSLPVAINENFILIVLSLILVFALIAAFIPALIAVRVTPIKAIRFK